MCHLHDKTKGSTLYYWSTCFSRFDDVTLETHVVGAEFPNKESVGSIPVEKQLTFCLMSSVALQVPRSHELCNNPYSPLALTNPNP